MILIGIAGNKGHGKDTVGSMLVDEYGFEALAFADPIKEAVKVALYMTDEQVYGTQAQKEAIDPRYGFSPRHAMQTLGTEWGRDLLREDIWPTVLWARIDRLKAEGFTKFCITDVRFPNEAKEIRDRGGVIVKVIRPGVETDAHSEHVSEALIDTIVPDYVIHNDANLGDLAGKVYAFWTEFLRTEVSRKAREIVKGRSSVTPDALKEAMESLVSQHGPGQVTVNKVEFVSPDKFNVTLTMPHHLAEQFHPDNDNDI